MKILLTGGAGFIGSNVVDLLIAHGHDVAIIDNLSTGNKDNINPKARLYLADIRDKGILREIFNEEKPDVVNHHAAQISVPYSVAHPKTDADVNILGTINLLTLAVEHDVKKLIFISSGGAIYGEAERTPTDETYPPRPMSPYAIAKFAGERYLDYFSVQHNLNYTVLRYSNVFGPRQIPHGEAGVVSIFIENIKAGRESTVFTSPEYSKGMVRDYVYVGDVARANLLALDLEKPATINIGGGIRTETLDLYYELRNLMGSTIECKIAGMRAGDLLVSNLDNSLAGRLIGWKPEHTLTEGLRKTVDWFNSK